MSTNTQHITVLRVVVGEDFLS
ncbi:hypothetical protein LINPERPRIM_LOCUS11519 [Linum perenne]